MSPFVLLVAAAVRLIVISNGDTTVATTVANARGVTGSLLGTVIPLLPPYLPLLALILILFRKLVLAGILAVAAALVSPAYGSTADGLKYAVTSIPHLSGMMWRGEWGELYKNAPAVLACVVAGIIFAFWGISEITSDVGYSFLTFARQARYVLIGTVCAAICTVGLLFTEAVYEVPFQVENVAKIIRRPWLPAEEIHTDDGKIYVGYVISTSDGWFLLMNEHDRTLTYIHADSVVDRRVCAPRSYRVEYKKPLLELRGAGTPVNNNCGAPNAG